MRGIPKDPRSTQRKRARRILFKLRIPYECNACHRSPKMLPSDAPDELTLSSNPDKVSQLQVNHINKDIMDNDPVNLEWLCPSCHKLKDKQTARGVSLKGDEWGYGIEDLGG